MSAMQHWLADRDRVRRARGLVRTTTTRPGALTGQTAALDLASNDYLALADDPRLARAAVDAIARYGTSARASRVVTGTLPPHEDAERALADLTGQPSALVLSSGYTANLAVLTALGSPGALLLVDEHAHASLHDAGRLSRSPMLTFGHQDLAGLRRLLVERTVPRAVVAVESVYSVLGDAADLPALAALCASHDALLVVDEAHGIGVLGEGRGGVHAAGLAGAEHVVVTATLSKALASQGGAVLGPGALREHLVNAARSFVFDTGLAPANAAAAAAACRVVAHEPDRVSALGVAARGLAHACGVPAAAGAVQSLPTLDAAHAVAATQRLRTGGVLVGCFRPPSVPDGVSRLRLTANAALTTEQVRQVGAQVTAALAATRPGSHASLPAGAR